MTTVVSTGESSPPDWTRFPSLIRARLTRPSMGETILVNSRFNSASVTAALAVGDRGLGDLQLGDVLLVLVLADCARGTQPLAARQVGLGLVRNGLQPRQLARARSKRRLVGPRVDLEQQVAPS